MTAWQTMFKGTYISATEFDGKKPTVTIKKITKQELESEDGQKKEKMTIWFENWTRGFVPSKTVAMCIAAMWGDQIEGWIGKRITLYATQVKLGKKMVPGIRVLGSPDLKSNIQVEIKLPKKKAEHVTLMVTKKDAIQTGEVTAKPEQPAPPPLAGPYGDGVEEPPPDVVLPGQTRPAESIDDAAERFAGL